MLRRLHDWDQRLGAYFTETRLEPFVWSRQDCAAWPLGAIDAMCGTDEVAKLRDSYDDFDSGVTYAQAQGWATLADAAEAVGCVKLPTPMLAQRGDIVFSLPREEMRPGEIHPPVLGYLFLNVDGSLYIPNPEGGLMKYPLRMASITGAVGYAVGRSV